MVTAAKPEQPSLFLKLLEVAKEVDHIEKKGYNTHFKYHYVTSNDMLNTLRSKLYERGVFLSVSQVGSQIIERSNGMLCTVRLKFSFTDVASGETVEAEWEGAGLDNQDKALYKAYTGCIKTFLEKTFLVPSDPADDPEADGQPMGKARAGAQGAAGSPKPRTGGSSPPPAATSQRPASSPSHRRFFSELQKAVKEGSMKAEYMDAGQAGSDARRALRSRILGFDIPADQMTEEHWNECAQAVQAERELWALERQDPDHSSY